MQLNENAFGTKLKQSRQVFVAYWLIVSSILLLNIFIALMADTFSRVYENAAVVARLEQAGNRLGVLAHDWLSEGR